MKELGRLLNRKTILLILAAACICVVAVFAGDFSDCGIDNYKIKVREYNWLINGHTDEQIQQHADELAQDDIYCGCGVAARVESFDPVSTIFRDEYEGAHGLYRC